MQHCDTILHADYIVTQNSKRETIHDGSVAIQNGIFCAVGTRSEIAQSYTATLERDMGYALMIPGLINAHTHAAMTLLRGYADDMPLLTWLTQKIFPIEARLTHEIVYIFSLLAFAEMLASGTTSCIDMYIFEEAVFEAAKKAGIRLHGGEGVFSFASAACKSYEEALERTANLAKTYAGNPQLGVMVNPHSIYTTTPEILKKCFDIADTYQIPIHMHLAESESETKQSLSLYGMRPFAYCQEQGFFDHMCTIAHCVDTDDSDLAILEKAKDTVVVHNPTSNLKLGSGIAKIPEMQKKSVPIALGTDGAASNNTLNMFSAINHTCLLHKGVRKDPECVSAQSVFDMATIGGAKALHRSDIGEIAVGKRADIAVLDLNHPNLFPMYSPISHLAYAASGHEVVLTMVNGAILFDHGDFTQFSIASLIKEAQKLQRYVTER